MKQSPACSKAGRTGSGSRRTHVERLTTPADMSIHLFNSQIHITGEGESRGFCTLVQDTGGRDWLMAEVCVDIVSRVVIPSITLAGTALASNQKETQDTITNMQQGRQNWIMQQENSRLKMRATSRQEYSPVHENNLVVKRFYLLFRNIELDLLH